MNKLNDRTKNLSPAKQSVLRGLLENKDISTERFLKLTQSNLVLIKKGDTDGPNIFMFPATDGSVGYFRFYSPYIPKSWNLYGCQAPGLDGEQEAYTNISDIAAHSVREIKKIQPHGPYHIMGNCMGGLPTFEAARQFEAMGDEVGLALHMMPLFDRDWKGLPKAEQLELRAFIDYVYVIERLLKINMNFPFEKVKDLAENERIDFLIEFISRNGFLSSEVEETMMRKRMATYQASLEAMLTYKKTGNFHGEFHVIGVGDRRLGESGITTDSPYAAHLIDFPENRMHLQFVNADPGALFDGSEPALGIAGARIKSMLEETTAVGA